jgi:phosphoglycolate phosphatase
MTDTANLNGLPRVVVFDLDGTLVDTAPDLAAAVNALLGEIGRGALSEASVKRMIGDGVAKLVERALAASGGPVRAEERERLVTRFLVLYERAPAAQARLFPGVAEALAQLNDAGTSLAVCTNKPTVATQMILAAVGIAPLFRVLACGDTLGVRKPDPALLNHVLDALRVPAADAVMVGDSVNDVAIARAAGARVVLVRHGYGAMPADTLDADAVIDDMHGLRQALGGLPVAPDEA